MSDYNFEQAFLEVVAEKNTLRSEIAMLRDKIKEAEGAKTRYDSAFTKMVDDAMKHIGGNFPIRDVLNTMVGAYKKIAHLSDEIEKAEERGALEMAVIACEYRTDIEHNCEDQERLDNYMQLWKEGRGK